jgi:hypothetical protein
VTFEPTKFPGFQVNEAAPDAVNVVELPLQITDGDALAIMVGVAFTFNVNNCVLLQGPVVPITVYVVEIIGLSVITVVFTLLGNQV